MSRLLRPLIFVSIVSFLLGLWLSLRKAETNLLDQMQELPQITLLTDTPDWWTSVARKARQERVAQLQIVSPSRTQWGEWLAPDRAKCDLVATHSYFLTHFLENKWLAPKTATSERWADQIHPDFRDLPGSSLGEFLPLLWSVTLWEPGDDKNPGGRLVVNTSVDDALFLALDLHPESSEPSEQDAEDLNARSKKIWGSSESEIMLNLAPTEFAVPTAPVKAQLLYAHKMKDPKIQTLESLPANSQGSLWYYGVGRCRNSPPNVATENFMAWLLKTENLKELANESDMALTAAAADNEAIPSNQRPSFLRQLPLGGLKRRELPWDLAAAWLEFWQTPQDSKAAR